MTIAAPAPVRTPVELTHAVHTCQVDARPRLALCGADCSDQVEDVTSNVCVVCADLRLPVLLVGRCARCDTDRPPLARLHASLEQQESHPIRHRNGRGRCGAGRRRLGGRS